MRRILVSRSSFEKPSPLLKLVRTSSPSSTSTFKPRSRKMGASASVSVVLPAPERPVNHNVKPGDILQPLLLKFSSNISILISHNSNCSAQSINQHCCNFWPREFNRWYLTAREHLTHFGAAQINVMLHRVRAGLGGRHRAAASAI